MHIVVCEDGAIRHASPFETKAEARLFAEWGHCCTKDHVLIDIDFARLQSVIDFAISYAQIPTKSPQGVAETAWMLAEEMHNEDVILLPFGRMVSVHTVVVGDHWVHLSTDGGRARLARDTKVYIERRN